MVGYHMLGCGHLEPVPSVAAVCVVLGEVAVPLKRHLARASSTNLTNLAISYQDQHRGTLTTHLVGHPDARVFIRPGARKPAAPLILLWIPQISL